MTSHAKQKLLKMKKCDRGLCNYISCGEKSGYIKVAKNVKGYIAYHLHFISGKWRIYVQKNVPGEQL